MRKLISLIAVLVVAATFVPSAFADDEKALSVDVTADFYSKYVWRGQLLNDDYVFQPGVSLTYSTEIGDFTGGVWGNLDMSDFAGEKGEFTEVDYYFDYTVSLTDTVSASVGYIYYDFPQSTTLRSTEEIYFGIGVDTFLSPSLTWYIDLDEACGGSYLSFSIGHTFEDVVSITEDIPVDIELGANIGWADDTYNTAYWGVKDSGFNDLGFSVALPMEIGGLSVTPSFNWTHLCDGDIRDATMEQDQFFTGISLGMSF